MLAQILSIDAQLVTSGEGTNFDIVMSWLFFVIIEMKSSEEIEHGLFTSEGGSHWPGKKM